jgi:hypothetical protein
MKRALLYMSILGVGLAVSSRADDFPQRLKFDRYQTLLDRSPFTVATASALPAATPDFAKDLYIANAAKSPDGDMVTLASSTDKLFKKYLTTREPVDGFSIASIEWSERVGATKVTVSKDGKFATLTFNQALLTQPAGNVPPPQAMAQPIPAPPLAVPPGQAVYPRPAPIPSIPGPPAHVRGVIQRNPTPVPVATPMRTPEPEL